MCELFENDELLHLPSISNVDFSTFEFTEDKGEIIYNCHFTVQYNNHALVIITPKKSHLEATWYKTFIPSVRLLPGQR